MSSHKLVSAAAFTLVAVASWVTPALAAGGHGSIGGHCHSGGGHIHISHGHYGHYHNYHGGGGYYDNYGPSYGATGGYLWGSGGGAYPAQSNEERWNIQQDARRRALPDSAFVQNYNWSDNSQPSSVQALQAFTPNQQTYVNYAQPGDYSAYGNRTIRVDPYATPNQPVDNQYDQYVALPVNLYAARYAHYGRYH